MKRIVLWLALALLPLTALAVEDPAGLERLKKGAESGDAEAMLELGILYEFGFRMRDHNAPALAWYRLAGEAGNAKAGGRYEALRVKASPKEIEEANKLYTEYSSLVRKPPPAAPPVDTPAAAPAATQ
jgi:TPR repeat protein